MADIKYYDVILKPVITEKSMNDMASKKYASMFILRLLRYRSSRQLKRCLKELRLLQLTL